MTTYLSAGADHAYCQTHSNFSAHDMHTIQSADKMMPPELMGPDTEFGRMMQQVAQRLKIDRVYLYVCIHMYVYVHTYIYIFIYVHQYTYMYRYINICVSIYIYMCMPHVICTYLNEFTHSDVYVYINIYIYITICKYIMYRPRWMAMGHAGRCYACTAGEPIRRS